MSDTTLQLLANTVLWPLLACVAIYALGQLLWRPMPLWLPTAALLAGAAVGMTLVHSRLQFPPASSSDRLLPLLVLAGGLLCLPRLRSPLGLNASRALLVLAAITWLLWPLLLRWPWLQVAQVLAAVGALWALLWWLARQGAAHPAGASSLLAPLALTAPVVAVDGSLLTAQFAGVLAAALGGWWLYSLWRAPRALGAAGSDWLAFALAAVLLLAHFYAGLEVTAALLLALSPLPGVLLLKPLARRPAWQSRLLVGGVAALPGLAALWLIWPEAPLY